MWAKWPIRPELIPIFLTWWTKSISTPPLDGMLVHRRVTPQFASTHLYTWLERSTVRVKCLAQEHNTMSPARAQTRTARSRDKHTNHEATASNITSPINKMYLTIIYFKILSLKIIVDTDWCQEWNIKTLDFSSIFFKGVRCWILLSL